MAPDDISSIGLLYLISSAFRYSRTGSLLICMLSFLSCSFFNHQFLSLYFVCPSKPSPSKGSNLTREKMNIPLCTHGARFQNNPTRMENSSRSPSPASVHEYFIFPKVSSITKPFFKDFLTLVLVLIEMFSLHLQRGLISVTMRILGLYKHKAPSRSPYGESQRSGCFIA